MHNRATALLLIGALLSGCSLGRDYTGAELRAVPAEILRPGETTIAQVLETFGAPDQIMRRRSGEILIYHYVRTNTSQLELEEPLITGIKFFTYRKRQNKANRLTLFFDDAGRLDSFGYTTAIQDLDML